jgi:tetratricopeptide (TPR) repeat protein
MSDSPRPDGSRVLDAAPDADRDAKIEQLLLAGLDQYFAARYQEAINIWTRALFLDRSHPRARAYIDRARSALAERQRESEELFHRGASAFYRGETEEARRLLQAAIDRGTSADEARALIERLNRVGGSATPGVSADDRPRIEAAVLTPAAPRPPKLLPRHDTTGRKWTVLLGAALAGISIVVVYAVAASDRRDGGTAFPPDAPGAAATAVSRDLGLPLPRRGDLALDRARSLAAGGRLHEALSILDRIRTTDPQKTEADRLRAEIQRQLLSLARLPRPLSAARKGEPRQP